MQQPSQTNNYIELKIRRDLGEIITDYFRFLKQNLKKFTNIFLSYNGIFLIGLLVVSYLLVSGFIGMITYSQNFQYLEGAERNMESTYILYIGIGSILFFFLFIAIAVMNYSLAGAYMIKYDQLEGNNFEKKQVWAFFKQHFGKIFLFTLLMVLIFIGVYIIGIMMLFIPIAGILVFYLLLFAAFAWFGVSFFAMLYDNKGVTEAFSEGWRLIKSNFWKSVGVNFILTLLNFILSMTALFVPGIIISIYSYHVVENDVNISESIVSTVIYTLGTAVYLIFMVYGQCLSQFVNGMLYFSLHEQAYNTHTRAKIEQIGKVEL